MGKKKLKKKIKNQSKRKGKINQINESNIHALKSKQFQDINGNNLNSHTPQSLQIMMGRSYIHKHVTRGGRGTDLPCPFPKI